MIKSIPFTVAADYAKSLIKDGKHSSLVIIILLAISVYQAHVSNETMHDTLKNLQAIVSDHQEDIDLMKKQLDKHDDQIFYLLSKQTPTPAPTIGALSLFPYKK